MRNNSQSDWCGPVVAIVSIFPRNPYLLRDSSNSLRERIALFLFACQIEITQNILHYQEELLRVREKVFLEVLKRVIVEIKKEVLKVTKRCKRCRSVLVRNGQEPKTIKTLLGAVEVQRVRLRCEKCEEDIYPLDQAIGLAPGERMTLGVSERSFWAAVEVSYEKTNQFLKKFTGLEVSQKKIRGMALEEGHGIEKWEEERRRMLFEEGQDIRGKKAPEVLYIQVDDTGINDRASGEWMECKVRVSFSQRVLVSKDRIWLMDKKSYASIEEAEAFGEKFFLECIKQGVLEAKEVVFIGDGASWVRRLKEDYFPEAIGVLDIWHLERELKKALGEEKRAVVEDLKLLAFCGRGSEIIQRLMKEGAKMKGVEERKKIVEAMTYVRSNLDWIENIPKVKGYGSGPVEKTVDITVARRFKKRGMSWYKKGANPLLKLRLLKLYGEWDAYWKERRKEFARYAA